MADINSKASQLLSELSNFKSQISSKLTSASSLYGSFQHIEDACSDLDLSQCLSKHDDFKLKRADVLRRRHKLMTDFDRECGQILPPGWDWKETLPILTTSELQKTEQFLTCFRPYMSKLLSNAVEEERVFADCIRDLQPMVPSQKH